jgi:alkaline phosphatase
LGDNRKGFFLMVEGSQIDWGGHSNDANYVISEVIDMDKAIGVALEFAERHGNTLVLVTADHETGGMVVANGNIPEGTAEIKFSTTDHTGTMVPVFASGRGAEKFTGVYENTDIFFKILALFNFSETGK